MAIVEEPLGAILVVVKESRGPTKRLAPTLAPGTCCPHEFNCSEGLQLEVGCDSCAGAQDLANRRCMIGIVNVLLRGALPDTIILKRFMHKRYRNEAVLAVAHVAKELSSLTRAAASASTSSDKRCRTCPCAPRRLLDEMRSKLLEDPSGYVRDRSMGESILADALQKAACDRGEECAAQARSASFVLAGGSA